MNLERGPLRPIRVLVPSKSNSKVDSMPYYKESTALHPYVNSNETKFKFVTYYPLHADHP